MTSFAALTCLSLLLVASAPARAMETDCLTRDPSTIIRRGDIYWVYGTGKGVRQFSSRDRIHWTFRGPVFPAAPEWVAAAVPENRNNISWAPDVHFFNGRYYLYFSYSTMGSRVSAIGVATNPTLDPARWKDEGIVVQTRREDAYNAIDPCIVEDAAGGMWLSFGSYFGGIKLVPIDSTTGKRPAGNSAIYSLAGRASGFGGAIEGSCIYYHDGYYYLFVNWDGCCAGSRSTYNIRVGRSRIITGPYLDRAGKEMNAGGGTLFLCSVYNRGTGAPFDDEVGPGHAAVLHDRDGDWFSYHEEWARDQHGATTLNINRLSWDTDGWPRMVLDPGPYKLVSNVETHDVARANKTGVDTWPFEAMREQQWLLHYVADGYYTIVNRATGTPLAVGQPAQPGARVTASRAGAVAASRSADAYREQWLLRQNDNGTFNLLNRSSGETLALDVTGCSILDGTALQLWTANNTPCQEWSFRTR